MFVSVVVKGELSNIPYFSVKPVIIPKGYHLLKTFFSFKLAHVSERYYTILTSSPLAKTDIPNALIEPALTPEIISY
jgi:hypothetical protein